MTWQRHAVCYGDRRMTDPDPDVARAAIAEQCARCPVTTECAMWAEDESTRRGFGFEGVAGGMWWVDGRPKRLPRQRPTGDVLEAHRRWNRGHRDEQTRLLERQYQATRKAEQRRRVAV